MNTASLFADPNLLQLESEAMINTDDAPSQRSADATVPIAPKKLGRAQIELPKAEVRRGFVDKQ
jgi:hypothetical protein